MDALAVVYGAHVYDLLLEIHKFALSLAVVE